MDGKGFWEKVDHQLENQGLSITELSELIGQSRNTLFSQRHRLVVPKAEQINRMEKALKCRFYDEDDSCLEYLPYLRKAEEWQLRSVRQILNMPFSPSSEEDGDYITKAN